MKNSNWSYVLVVASGIAVTGCQQAPRVNAPCQCCRKQTDQPVQSANEDPGMNGPADPPVVGDPGSSALPGLAPPRNLEQVLPPPKPVGAGQRSPIRPWQQARFRRTSFARCRPRSRHRNGPVQAPTPVFPQRRNLTDPIRPRRRHPCRTGRLLQLFRRRQRRPSTRRSLLRLSRCNRLRLLATRTTTGC